MPKRKVKGTQEPINRKTKGHLSHWGKELTAGLKRPSRIESLQ